jgi:hypothetical protein
MVEKVSEEISVPWTGANHALGTTITSIAANYPGCAVSNSTATVEQRGKPTEFGVLVKRAYGACHIGPRAVRISTNGSDLVSPVRYAPVGPVQTGRPPF